MEATEPLGTGTFLLIDGRRAGAGRLSDPDALSVLLHELASSLEAEVEPVEARVVEPDGSSHGLLLDEAHLVVHAFPRVESFAFAAFSRHALTDVELYGRVLRSLRTGRFESRLRRSASGMPRDPAALERRLGGERSWARARLVDPPQQALD